MVGQLLHGLQAVLHRVAPDIWTAHFWDGARDHRLVALRRASCGKFREFEGHTPYVLAVVDPVDAPGVRLVTNVVTDAPDALNIGQPCT